MVLLCLFQGAYVWDALYNERAILTTMDITTDGCGPRSGPAFSLRSTVTARTRRAMACAPSQYHCQSSRGVSRCRPLGRSQVWLHARVRRPHVGAVHLLAPGPTLHLTDVTLHYSTVQYSTLHYIILRLLAPGPPRAISLVAPDDRAHADAPTDRRASESPRARLAPLRNVSTPCRGRRCRGLAASRARRVSRALRLAAFSCPRGAATRRVSRAHRRRRRLASRPVRAAASARLACRLARAAASSRVSRLASRVSPRPARAGTLPRGPRPAPVAARARGGVRAARAGLPHLPRRERAEGRVPARPARAGRRAPPLDADVARHAAAHVGLVGARAQDQLHGRLADGALVVPALRRRQHLPVRRRRRRRRPPRREREREKRREERDRETERQREKREERRERVSRRVPSLSAEREREKREERAERAERDREKREREKGCERESLASLASGAAAVGGERERRERREREREREERAEREREKREREKGCDRESLASLASGGGRARRACGLKATKPRSRP